MKLKDAILAMILLTASVQVAQAQTTGLTSAERTEAIRLLKETRDKVNDALINLREEQLAFKPAPDKWSIEECVKHIAAAEQALWQMVRQSLDQPANPDQKANIRLSDEELVKAVIDRSQKSKTFAALEPSSSPYETPAEAQNAFRSNRDKLIAFVGTTQEDLRNHVSVLPIGTFDAYQFILLIGAHTGRHTQQIEEVKAAAGFPGKS